jgi:hypothetical protein
VNERWYRAFNLCLLIVITFLVVNIQSVFWFHLLGEFTAPRLWLVILTYFALRRRFWESVAGLFMLSLIAASHSLAPWGVVFLVGLPVLLTLQAIKDRIYMETTAYFTWMALICVTIFNLCHLIFSSINDMNPIAGPDILRWVTQSLTTAGFAPLMLSVLEWVDEVTKRDIISDTTGDSVL